MIFQHSLELQNLEVIVIIIIIINNNISCLLFMILVND